MSDFVEQLNAAIAPVTRAWCDPQIVWVQVRPENIAEDEITVAVVVKLRRKKFAAVAEENRHLPCKQDDAGQSPAGSSKFQNL
jgi:hypothetical protein